MKKKPTLLTRYILVQFVALCFSANLFAQQVNINFENTPIKTILKEITTQTGYNFVYSDALKSLDKQISVSYSSTNQPIDNLLKKIFEGTDIIYSIKDCKRLWKNGKTRTNKVSVWKLGLFGVLSLYSSIP